MLIGPMGGWPRTFGLSRRVFGSLHVTWDVNPLRFLLLGVYRLVGILVECLLAH